MSKHNYILTVDVGTSTLKVAEFLVSGNSLELQNFAIETYVSETVDDIPLAALAHCFKKIVSSNHFTAKKVFLSISGHYIYTRFSKIPSNMLDAKAQKIRQVINYEAKQNIPYSLDEVTWSYRLNKTENAPDVGIMFSVIKTEHVVGIVSIFEQAGFSAELVESDPSAIYSGAYDVLGDEACKSVVVNIGNRCTIVEFFEKDSFYVRVIPIGGGLITQQISKTLEIKQEEAELIKHEYLSSITAVKTVDISDSDSKKIQDIGNSIISRILGEVIQSINIYKSQHNNIFNLDKVYLCGGSSVIKNLDTAFSSKLQVPIEYLNLFKTVSISNDLDKRYFASICHVLPGLIGLAKFSSRNLNYLTSLLPKLIEDKHIAKKKIPYYYGIAVVVFLTLLTIYFEITAQSKLLTSVIDNSAPSIKYEEAQISNINKLKTQIDAEKNLYDYMGSIFDSKNRWFYIIKDIQDSLPDNVWVSSLSPIGTPNVKVLDVPLEEKNTSGSRTIFGAKKSVVKQTKQVTVTDFNSGRIDWLRITGYSLIIFNNDDTITEVEKFRDALLKKTSFGDKADDVIISDYKVPKSNLNIREFDILVKLKTPIDV